MSLLQQLSTTGSLTESQRQSGKNGISSLLHKEGLDTVCPCVGLVSMSCYHSVWVVCLSVTTHRKHPAMVYSASRAARSVLIRPQHATVSTVVLFRGLISWLLESLTFLFPSPVSTLWKLCTLPHGNSVSCLSFATMVLLQYGGAVFPVMDHRREDVAVGGWQGGSWREGPGAGRLCSVAGLVKLIDEKGKRVFLAGWGFILLAALIHLSRFRVAAAEVAIALQGC